MAADTKIPAMGDPAERAIPCLQPDAMAQSKPYVAAPAHNEPLGFPGELVPDWQEKGIARMGELLGKYKSLQVYMDICVKCGACTDKCHYFLGTGDPKNMPVARQDLFRSVYRRYFTPVGKALGAVGMGEAGRRAGIHQGGVGRMVQLLPPVFAMPPLLGVLPLWHRHRRSVHGGPRHHGQYRPGP